MTTTQQLATESALFRIENLIKSARRACLRGDEQQVDHFTRLAEAALVELEAARS